MNDRSKHTSATIALKLQSLIDEERAALLNGDFDRIATLINEKEALISALREAPDTAEILSPLRIGLRRNHELFDHALAGLRNVAARLGDLNRARKSIDTYDRQGKKQSIGAPETRKLERRA